MLRAGSTLHAAENRVTDSYRYLSCTIFGGILSDTYITAVQLLRAFVVPKIEKTTTHAAQRLSYARGGILHIISIEACAGIVHVAVATEMFVINQA